MKALEAVSYSIKQKNAGVKRSIKFDDMSRSLAMDVKLPGSAWVRIFPAQIIQASRGRVEERPPAVSEVLAISNQPLEDIEQEANFVEEDAEMPAE